MVNTAHSSVRIDLKKHPYLATKGFIIWKCSLLTLEKLTCSHPFSFWNTVPKSPTHGSAPPQFSSFFPLQLVSQLACLWPVLATLRFQSLAFSVTSSKGFLCAAPKSLQLIGRISNSFTMEHPANKRLNARRSWEVAISMFKAHNCYCTSSCAWSPFTSNLTVYKCSSLNWITILERKKPSKSKSFQALNQRVLTNPLSIKLHNSHHISPNFLCRKLSTWMIWL